MNYFINPTRNNSYIPAYIEYPIADPARRHNNNVVDVITFDLNVVNGDRGGLRPSTTSHPSTASQSSVPGFGQVFKEVSRREFYIFIIKTLILSGWQEK